MKLDVRDEAKALKFLTKPSAPTSWIEDEIDFQEKDGELWQWESLILYYFKIDAREIPDDNFFDLCARLRFVIKSQQSKFNLEGAD